MSHIPTHTDPLTQAIADALLQRIDIDHLGQRIAHHLSQTDAAHAATQSAAAPYNPNDPYPVQEIRRQLGRRGRPMADVTFRKNYLDNHRLRLIPGPSRRQLYVRRGDWERLQKEAEKKAKK